MQDKPDMQLVCNKVLQNIEIIVYGLFLYTLRSVIEPSVSFFCVIMIHHKRYKINKSQV